MAFVIPAGTTIFCDLGACPPGYVPLNDMNESLIRGGAYAPHAGGSDTHSHGSQSHTHQMADHTHDSLANHDHGNVVGDAGREGTYTTGPNVDNSACESWNHVHSFSFNFNVESGPASAGSGGGTTSSGDIALSDAVSNVPRYGTLLVCQRV